MPVFEWRIDDDLSLRLWEMRDAEAAFALIRANRDHLRQWLGWVHDDSTVEDTKSFIRRSQQQWLDNNGYNLAIWYRGELAGGAGHHPINHINRNVSLGYWMGAQFQGKGIMTRAARALTDVAFQEFGLNRVEIRAATGNTHSQRVAERLGFVREGHIREAEWLYDHFVDHYVFGMLARDWQAQKDATQ